MQFSPCFVELDPISSEDTITRHALKYRATQASVSGRHHFSFQEAESRIRHNHLTLSPDHERAVYIDTNLRVISVRLNHDTFQPSFIAIYDLPQPIQTPASDSPESEYPSSVFVDAHTLICADGRGTLHVLTLSSNDSAKLLGVYELLKTLNSSSSSLVPFRVHAALLADGRAIALLSFKSLREGVPPDPSSNRKTPPVEFDLVAVRVPLQAVDDNNAVSPLDVLWHRRGTNVPLYTAYEKHRDAFILAGSSPYRPIGQPAPERHGPSPDEFAPIPRAGAGIDSRPPQSSADATSPPKPPPYAWTQGSEEVTVAFPLPSSTPKGDITVHFSPQTLTALVRGHDVDAPHYAAVRLWGGVVPSSSFWTWDAHGARAYGLLTLHLEKQHAGTRWPHLFDDDDDASAGAGGSGPPVVDVPETLDPSQLYAVLESLEKYTAALNEGGPGAGGLLRPSSLNDGEVDDEVDAAVGVETCITWVAASDGAEPAWAREDRVVPFTALSTALPGVGGEISMVVKHAIDGLLFVLSDDDTASSTPAWAHSSTFPALAFVLASKRDTRFTYHVPSKAVLAFEGGSAESGGNLYIYRDAKPKSNRAKQAILKLAGNASGSLLGAGAIRNGKELAIICLCEGELLVLRNVL
ncbi:hypothetical protein F5148DRAFT_899995 [Russula earlei]|uniref:Uncharacterized protein n=1 Tax=Russula earlei TaxID=71964 RepID=A0ACC0UL34_9AGAM|nr:hypothetical protein F5148DRAFT_899995 [Russula earlei]